jgi:hypothetical protein
MKSKEPAKSKRQSVTLKDLKTRKNPKGGAVLPGARINTAKGIVITGGTGATTVSVGSGD